MPLNRFGVAQESHVGVLYSGRDMIRSDVDGEGRAIYVCVIHQATGLQTPVGGIPFPIHPDHDLRLRLGKSVVVGDRHGVRP